LQLGITKLTALFEQAVHHRGFAVVHVSDNNNVSDIGATHRGSGKFFLKPDWERETRISLRR
jgi:hypothetical protein